MRTVVAKFGGTSLASAAQFIKVQEIVKADPDRRFVVASAPGKRFPEDIKVTDLLLRCYEAAAGENDFEPILEQIALRFREIIAQLGIDFPLDNEIDILRNHLQGDPREEYVVSRG